MISDRRQIERYPSGRTRSGLRGSSGIKGMSVVVPAALLVAALALWRIQRPMGHQATPPMPMTRAGDASASAPIHVYVQTVTPSASPVMLEAVGVVRPEEEAGVAARIMGRVQRVLVHEGDRVRRGQPLVLLEAQDLDAAIAQAEANRHAADMAYANAQTAARLEAMLSPTRIAAAASRLREAEAAHSAANARLALALAGPRQQEREQAALAVAQAQSNLSLAESELRRMSTLYRDDAISAQQYDQYKTRYAVAQAQYDTARQAQAITEEGSRAEEIQAARENARQAQAAVDEARAALDQAHAAAMQVEMRRDEVRSAAAQQAQTAAALRLADVNRGFAQIDSPCDGVASRRMVDPGAMAAPGTPLLILRSGAIRLEAIVPESALAAVRNDATVPMALPALSRRILSGRVAEIAPQGDARSHTFVVKIDLPAGCGARPGMFGKARFQTGTERRLLIPASALIEREGLRYLMVVGADAIARLRLVTVGDAADGRVPVLSGLNAGERIVLSDPAHIPDGATVSPEAR
jgi:HlyD family secretion protein